MAQLRSTGPHAACVLRPVYAVRATNATWAMVLRHMRSAAPLGQARITLVPGAAAWTHSRPAGSDRPNRSGVPETPGRQVALRHNAGETVAGPDTRSASHIPTPVRSGGHGDVPIAPTTFRSLRALTKPGGSEVSTRRCYMLALSEWATFAHRYHDDATTDTSADR
jgi:hypothetical protein